MTNPTDYQTLRSTAGVYVPSGPLVRVTGDDRLGFMDAFLSRSAEYVDIDTTRECLALDAEGRPFAIFLHLEREEESWLMPRTPLTAAGLSAYLEAFVEGDVQVSVAPDGWGAVAIEGPTAWRVAAQLVDFDVAGLVLHSLVDVVVPGSDDGSSAFLARVGTTGEYGYLLVSDAPEAARLFVVARTQEIGGAEVGTDALARVQAEAGMPYYAMGVRALGVNEADLSWLVDWHRLGEFHGSAGLEAPVKEQRKLAPLAAATGSVLAAGEAVHAQGTQVGTVVYQAPSANPEEELAFAVFDAPYWVPTLEMDASVPVTTVTLPRVLALSSVEKIG